VNLQSVSVENEGRTATARGQLVPQLAGDVFGARKFAENFEALVNAAGSAKQLKELVLKLAVSGGLSSVSGETADSLLAQLQRQRLLLGKNGVRIGDLSPPVAEDEAPYAIPPGWRWIRLRDLGGFLGGGTPSKSNASFWEGPLPWVSPKDMKRPYIDDAEDHISTSAVEGSAVKLIPTQSILCVVRGMILAHSFPVAIATREVTINQDMKALVLALPALSEFILRSCQAARTRVLAKVEHSSHGTCRLASEVVEMLPIALPPLAEQKEIVARVDQLMALIDDLEAKQTKKRDLSTRFTKASLEALATAESREDFDTAWQRVVENWDCACTDSHLVAEVRALCLWLALSGRLGPTEVGDEQWRDTTLGELAELVTSGSRGWKEFYAAEGALFIRSQDIKTDALDLATPAFVNLPTGAEGKRTRVQNDDLLVTITGANVGKAARVTQSLPEAYVSQHVALIRLRDPRHAPWVHTWLVSPRNGRATLTATSYGDKPGLNLDNVKSVPIRIPSLVMQQSIIAKVEHLMKLCDDLEAKLRRAEDRASKLVEAVVQEMLA